ncbi:T9SS type A sorting domain-containing protein [Salibacter halophilus]|uniref:T9SS type A sorting domain-containing protein n=1 Tax=Salibacter halophilus TaxID=1803916 RepID=A0A6N6M625_9FLAO|nr:T9SS type A sorting domain-containing protein [Salibacter halophilus]KAB1065161.1 T9SS type A sorting domain-containing protein [Salibacter halophilus]
MKRKPRHPNTKRILGLSKLLFLMGIFQIGSLAVNAQNPITIGTGTMTTSNVPITGNGNYTSYSQHIYHASDITSGGGQAGQLTKIAFKFISGDISTCNDWTIYVGHTTKTNFTSTNDWVTINNLTQTFSGTLSQPGNNTWQEIEFDTPFQWNGTDNIVIAIDQNNGAYTSSWTNPPKWEFTGGGNNRSIYFGAGWSDPNTDPASPPTADATHDFPNIQMTILTACTGTPTAGTITGSDSVCVGNKTTLGLQNSSLSSNFNLSLMWEMNDGSGWTQFDTTETIETDDITVDTEFRCIMTCDNSGLTDTADFFINAVPLPDASVSPSSYALCSGSSVPLNASVSSGAASFDWSPSNGLSGTSGPSVTATPTSSTTYSITATDSTTGCVSVVTSKVSPITDLRVSTGVTPAQICSANNPITIDVTDAPSGLSGSGSWEYQWYDTAGTVLQSWSPISNYSFTPSVNGRYNFKVQLRSTACPNDTMVNLSSANVTVGAGAMIDTTDIDCYNPLGAFDLFDIYGQAGVDTVFTIDFANDNSGLTTMYGDATIENNKLALTPSVTGISGGAFIENPAGTEVSKGFVLAFDMTVDQPIDNYGTGGADGMAYSFGDDVAQSSSPNGTGSKLRISFDAADNSSTNGNVKGIYLAYGWSSTNAFGPNTNEVLAYSSNTSLWKGKAEIPTKIEVNAQGQVTLEVDGTVVFDNIQLPASYIDADKSDWTHSFNAATGGDAERHAISDLSMISSKLVYGITDASSTNPPANWQESTHFSDLNVGEYNIWIANPDNHSCASNLGTFGIRNLFPIVDLGNDTTICPGESLTLNAGNPDATYLWSPSNSTSQSITVSDEGTYFVSVTDTAGCTSMTSIEISHATAPSGDNIFTSGAGYDYSFFVVNPTEVGTYDWYYGDGDSTLNGGSSINHTYQDTGSYDVTVILGDKYGCGSTDTITKSIFIERPAGIFGKGESQVSVYPNPVKENLNLRFPSNNNIQRITITSVNGQEVYNKPVVGSGQMTINVSEFNSGVYFLSLFTENGSDQRKIIITP